MDGCVGVEFKLCGYIGGVITSLLPFHPIDRSSSSSCLLESLPREPATASNDSKTMSTNKPPSRFGHLPLSTTGPLDCALSGTAVLNDPFFNKGTAFTLEERRAFGLHGLLPDNVQSLETQARRARDQYASRPDDLAKNTFLTSMKEQNAVLYYKLLQDNIKDMFSVVYTPTEGDAIQNYSRLFRRPEGCFLNINHKERVRANLAQWGNPEDIDYIVVTDGEEILGIGDQGVGGILISVAKLVLATLCAGVHPNRCLPVVLDCGTDNRALLDDELYLGLRERRVRGERYDAFVAEFVAAARSLYPKAYIHFEDFGLSNARRLLDTYRPRMACFNDDVQGTGCVTLAAIMAGLHVSGQTLADVRMVVFGAGSAGVGIADQVRDAIAAEGGISHEKAAEQIWYCLLLRSPYKCYPPYSVIAATDKMASRLIDKPGLVTTKTDPSPAQRLYAKDASAWSNSDTSLLGIVKSVHPNVLIGTSTVPGAFTRDIVTAMAAHAPRPIIFPLSNPTRLHEAKPADLLAWTHGKALVATGSPFPPVSGPWADGDGDANGARDGSKGNKEVTVEIAECNNSVVFPGIGLGCILARAARLSDKMLVAAVRAVADLSPARSDPTAPLLPDVRAVRDVSVRVACGVIRAAQEEGHATTQGIPAGGDADGLEEWVREQMWEPRYRPLRRVGMEGATRAARGELRKAGTLLDSLLASAETALAHAHSARDISLGHDADREVQRLLDPLCHPLPRVHATVVEDLLDLVRNATLKGVTTLIGGTGRQRRRGVEPPDPFGRYALADGGELDLVHGVENEYGEADVLVAFVLLLDCRRLLLLLGRRGARKERLIAIDANGLDGQEQV
ncbi:LOW QUALITY PROTEIN: NAD-dependent malic enzyme, mitochondrial [Purpureocillium lavendulum]|uniref:Malic enzyme n=1 Tax=Purpureocillium lavendulum TaxID=1247861 RepID=A0AB34FV38_9HYPO|nr:LOW QUALITY PROTEIN: NAD-dependent malic enzyme, mitochondrial [Purpureocillium lavendulum]